MNNTIFKPIRQNWRGEYKSPLGARFLLALWSLFLSFNTNAWMDDWAPAFKCTLAKVQALPETTVSNFVCSVKSGDVYWDFDNWEYCKGYSIDLNGDGINDSVFIIPWMGCGLAAQGYDAHFRVSTGTTGWAYTVIKGYGISKDDLVTVAGKTYFRHSRHFCGFEKSKHNHWVYQLFSFDKNGDMICSNGDFGKLFPAVTIYYIKPKFKQIELTKGDLKEIDDETKRIVRRSGQGATVVKEDFDLFNYRYLWNDDAEKAKMVVNPASKKKEAEDWKPPRKLTDVECTKLIRIMTDRFGEPAKCRKGYASFVYVWRFEGDEWLSVGVSTMANMGGDPIAIHHWAWRKPALSVYTETEMKEREYPIVQIEIEGLPPAAFFEFFDPYSGFKEGETDHNVATEFNATKYLGLVCPRCTAEWDEVDHKYDIWTKYPDKRRGEITYKGGGDGKHTNECHVGAVQFYKLAPDLFMCNSLFCVDGTLGADRARYLFEVYDRDIWSIDSDKPIKSKMVRYLGTFSIADVPKFREQWIRAHGNLKSVAPFSETQAELPGTPCKAAPEKAERLAEFGAFALFSGETAEDSAYNKTRSHDSRNSLFLRHRRANGKDEWRVLLTTGSNWREAAEADGWCSDRARDVKNCFYVFKASFSSDGRHLWLVCNPHTYTYSVVCSYDVCNQTFRVLIDGDTADEQPDGTILAKNKKTYLFDDNGEPLGARFYDAWIDPDGKIVRKGKLKTAEEVD